MSPMHQKWSNQNPDIKKKIYSQAKMLKKKNVFLIDYTVVNITFSVLQQKKICKI